MKLLVAINSFGTGGAEKLVINTIPKMQQDGIDVHVLVLNQSSSHSSYILALEDSGIPVINLSVANIYNPVLVPKIMKVLERGAFDAIHVHLFPCSYWMALAHRFTNSTSKLYFTEHSTKNGRRGKPYLKFIERFIYRTYTKIVAITPEVKAELVDWLGGEFDNKIVHIPNGIDFSHLNSLPAYDKDTFCKEQNWDVNSTLLLMTASFRYPKRQDLLIEALHALPEIFCLLLAGEGENMEGCKQQVTELNLQDRVRFLGFREDVGRLMKTVDFNILYTDHEGMSGVALESLASGTMFIGSNVNGIKDIVPGNDYLFDTKENLVEKILKYNSESHIRDSIIENGVLHSKKYNIDEMIDSYEKLYFSN